MMDNVDFDNVGFEDEDWYPVTLEFTIPGTDNFHRIDCLDKKEEEDALAWMHEQCGEDFGEWEWR